MAGGHLSYCDLATGHQRRAYDIVREYRALTVSRVNRRNSTFSDSLRPVPKLGVGGWVWVYNKAATICQGAKPDTDAKVRKAKLLLNWTGPYKVLALGPCSSGDTPDGSPLGAKLLCLDLPCDMPGTGARRAYRFNAASPVPNPHDRGDIPKYWIAGLTIYVLNNSPKKSPAYHITQDDLSTPLQ